MNRPNMRQVLCVAAMGLLLGGCKSQATKISESMHLLEMQNKAWNICLEECRKGQPDLYKLGGIYGYLGDRIRLRMQEDYPKSNKAEAIGLIKELGDEYKQNVMDKMRPTPLTIELQPGVTSDDICKAFIAMNDKYQKLVEITK